MNEDFYLKKFIQTEAERDAARAELEHYNIFGHKLGCPKCGKQLTSLLLCGDCGIRYELIARES